MRHGENRREARRPKRRGFTLIEILLVLALISLLAAVLFSGISELFRAQEKTMDDIFWQAVHAARLQAVEGDVTVELRYDEKNKLLRWRAGDTVETLPWPGKSVEFFPVEKRDTVLIGGQLTDTNQLAGVRFFSDGSTENFRAQLTGTDGHITHLDIDPWTCAQIVHPKP